MLQAEQQVDNVRQQSVWLAEALQLPLDRPRGQQQHLHMAEPFPHHYPTCSGARLPAAAADVLGAVLQ
jgi:hypothetical protein